MFENCSVRSFGLELEGEGSAGATFGRNIGLRVSALALWAGFLRPGWGPRAELGSRSAAQFVSKAFARTVDAILLG